MATPESPESFSQYGEDLIVRDLFDELGIATPTYLDIGAYHPFHYNNTALFYEAGSEGVNVEPNHERIELFEHARPKDINLAIGIAAVAGKLTYYEFKDKELVNTFSEEEAYKSQARGHVLQATTVIPVSTIGEVVDTHCEGKFPDLLSIDAEGFDYEILQSMTHLPTTTRPRVICAETLAYTEERGGSSKLTNIIDLLRQDGYVVRAETSLNTIFERSADKATIPG